MRRATPYILALGTLTAATLIAVGDADPASQPAGAGQPAEPAGNLDYWLRQAKPVDPAATAPAGDGQEGRNPFTGKDGFRRTDALPGAVEMSDGTQIAGGLYTTVDQPWIIWVEQEKRWRLIPFAAVLSLTAVVVEEKMEQEWRWKAMGVPERVYTGRQYPTRRFLWKLHLVDGSTVTGAIKGQPLWVESPDQTHGPLILHERSKGQMGQTLADLPYIKKIVVSPRMMQAVLADSQALPASRPAPQSRPSSP